MNKSQSQTINLLDTYCQNMADSVILLLDKIDLNKYLNFLEMMYHYTRDSGKRLQHAAEQAQDEEIKKVFAELAREEQYHYRLAEGDLQTFGKQPVPEAPSVVLEFDQFWMNISSEEEYQYVGALYVLENVARLLKTSVMPHFVRLNIGPEQGKFILTHLVADDDHGDQLRLLCHNNADIAKHQIEMGAQKASTFWIKIHHESLN
ncbi:iron-containing redox enzyme family protein [Legionella cincinnatiensis]|uniref:Uncharacterized conserved protein n=1 Tax=Legionella cincinnatiensis TaxID=28085 RepID=A0A378IMM5_9GAMM|nr:iron-containing redox enzyme family protein [Legionella cincinnatiensis]KTC85238.1 hypothetical protein Lcin_1738 [Legionella cincinnatiensis]STX36399.1 Uncharacterized conserved protein [Legionella cincinnatiensis]